MNDKPRASLKINALSQWFALGLELAVGLTLTPFIVRDLGKEAYGVWMLLIGVFGYYGILGLGIDSAVMRFLAFNLARGEREEATSVLSSATIGLSVIGVVVACASFVLGDDLAVFLEVDQARRPEFTHLVQLLSCSVLGTFLASTAAAALKAREQFVPVNIIMGTASLVRAGVTIGLLSLGWGINGAALGMVAAITLRLVAMGAVALRNLDGVRISIRSCRWSTMRALLAFGLGGTLMVVGTKLRSSLDGVVISKTLDLGQVGVYAVAAAVLRYVNNMVAVSISVLAPRFTTLDAQGDREGLVALFVRSLGVAAELSLGICLVVVVVGGAFIDLWVGEGFAAATPVLWILVAGMAPAMVQNPGISLYYATNRHRTYAWINLAEGGFNVLLSIIFVRWFGLLGIAMGTTLPLLVNKLLVTPWYTCRILGIGQARYWRPTLPSLVATMISMAICRGFLWGPISGWPPLADLFGRAAAAGLVYLASHWAVSRGGWRQDVQLIAIVMSMVRKRLR